MGEQYEQMVNEIVNMGFPIEKVKEAMKAAFNFPQRAIEYLLSGNIPTESP